jgi:hypothetical protein
MYKAEYQNPNLQNKLQSEKNFVYKIMTLDNSSAEIDIMHFQVIIRLNNKNVFGSVS